MIFLFVLMFFTFLLYMVLSIVCLIQQELEIKDLLEDIEELRKIKYGINDTSYSSTGNNSGNPL